MVALEQTMAQSRIANGRRVDIGGMTVMKVARFKNTQTMPVAMANDRLRRPRNKDTYLILQPVGIPARKVLMLCQGWRLQLAGTQK